jgi:hypothetical protein
MSNLAIGTAVESLRYPAPGTEERPALVRKPSITQVTLQLRKKRRACKREALTIKLEGFYREGVSAFERGLLLTDTPYAVSEPMARCAWAGGWCDAQRGMVKESDYVEC